jgi:hypothetical protein
MQDVVTVQPLDDIHVVHTPLGIFVSMHRKPWCTVHHTWAVQPRAGPGLYVPLEQSAILCQDRMAQNCARQLCRCN